MFCLINYLNKEKTLNEIALSKGVLVSTIFSHMAKIAEQGVLDFEDMKRIYPIGKIETFKKAFNENRTRRIERLLKSAKRF